MLRFLILLSCLLITIESHAEDGYNLWLRYNLVENKNILNQYRNNISGILIKGESEIIQAAKNELTIGLGNMLGTKLNFVKSVEKNATLIVGTSGELQSIRGLNISEKAENISNEGYFIESREISGKHCIIIAGNSDIGVLYGVFGFLRLLQSNADIRGLKIAESPKINLRLLNHWDNLNRFVERGYAGSSLWDWHKLPDYLSPRYTDYARANASIGINGTVLTNVNANSTILTQEYLIKVAALANVFRPYGIKVYLTARFNAPVEIGGLKTADPLDSSVIAWWNDKVKEIYTVIPDFGGFLVKANSEGQPGPQNYGRNHAEGANLLANALSVYGGIVMWRAFVYSHEASEDRAKQAYNEFKPLDSRFKKNVFVQVKNGPVDFQPREPFHPLFGAMPDTPLMMEYQITQEYLGFSTHLVYLGSLFKETLNHDTYAKGKGSEVAKIIDGTLDHHSLSGIAGVSNTGTDRNWCGSHFAQANWYAFGRLSWDHSLTSEAIAEEWIRRTFSNDFNTVKLIKKMMLASREAAVNYMTPLGLHHIMGWDHHYGPGPWNNTGRPDWTSTYYHRADSAGIGFNRTPSGSNASSQYHKTVADSYSDINTCPENLLLWFHHAKWDYRLKNGHTLWDELCYKYYSGADTVSEMLSTWNSLKNKIDSERFNDVQTFLRIQQKEAIWWRNACILYFQTFSKRPLPQGLEKPSKSLEYYMNIKNKFVPGI
jgi:alpha-glucuronidase